jgi:hypothetical protein
MSTNPPRILFTGTHFRRKMLYNVLELMFWRTD